MGDKARRLVVASRERRKQTHAFKPFHDLTRPHLVLPVENEFIGWNDETQCFIIDMALFTGDERWTRLS
jgi:hypothetical protein